MKKLLSLAVALCLCITLLGMTTGCNQEKDFDTDANAVLAPAVKLFDYFYQFCLPVDENISQEVNGKTYYKVDFETYPTYQSLSDKIYATFSQEIGDQLFAQGHYIDIDGALYADNYDNQDKMDPNITNVSYILSEEQNKIIHYKAIVSYLPAESNGAPEMKEYYYDYELVDDQWLFTRFEYFWVDTGA